MDALLEANLKREQVSLEETRGIPFVDRFNDDRECGSVIGSSNSDGVIRRGVDVEGQIGIDNQALRIRPLVKPGWGRAGIAYGPYQRSAGLTFGALVLNGHNTSQSGHLSETLKRRIIRWAKASETDTLGHRLIRFISNGHKKNFINQVRRWFWIDHDYRDGQTAPIDENLAVGWFPEEIVDDPIGSGNAFVVHAAGPDNGELWTRVGEFNLPVIRGLQNVPLYYVVVLRERGAVYYLASYANVLGAGAYPEMRPIAVDIFQSDPVVYAGINQSVLGQIGFRVDTRVYAAQVNQIPEYASRYGTAHAADSLTGEGTLHARQAEVGGQWHQISGEFQLSERGAAPAGCDNLAILDPGKLSGLIHLLIEPPGFSNVAAGLIWRYRDVDNYWVFILGRDVSWLRLCLDGVWIDIASSDEWRLECCQSNSIQILDDGENIGITLNGRLVFNTWFSDSRLADASGLGIQAQLPHPVFMRALEAHPRSVSFPPVFQFPPLWQKEGEVPAVADDFEGAFGPLDGQVTSLGEKVWRREIGWGKFIRMGNSSVRVQASREQPNPGRTAYLVDWDAPEFADLQVQITPPGTRRGEWEQGRGGLIFWQDPDNYIIVNTWLDDHYEGASISSFFYLNGFEDLYDAVWTNVGKRIYWGVPYRLRVVFDGLNYTAYVEDEPVLYRSLRDVYPHCQPLAIHRVGLVANWEWGNDTGSVFRNFIARTNKSLRGSDG